MAHESGVIGHTSDFLGGAVVGVGETAGETAGATVGSIGRGLADEMGIPPIVLWGAVAFAAIYLYTDD